MTTFFVNGPTSPLLPISVPQPPAEGPCLGAHSRVEEQKCETAGANESAGSPTGSDFCSPTPAGGRVVGAHAQVEEQKSGCQVAGDDQTVRPQAFATSSCDRIRTSGSWA